mmetsp:Transcript_31515/g.62294  ORF Transcript_31515/g.62294 Transcript_31515/m.62294 type:complete len:339 (-) Transcript_31515:744-1760(-)
MIKEGEEDEKIASKHRKARYVVNGIRYTWVEFGNCRQVPKKNGDTDMDALWAMRQEELDDPKAEIYEVLCIAMKENIDGRAFSHHQKPPFLDLKTGEVTRMFGEGQVGEGIADGLKDMKVVDADAFDKQGLVDKTDIVSAISSIRSGTRIHGPPTASDEGEMIDPSHRRTSPPPRNSTVPRSPSPNRTTRPRQSRSPVPLTPPTPLTRQSTEMQKQQECCSGNLHFGDPISGYDMATEMVIQQKIGSQKCERGVTARVRWKGHSFPLTIERQLFMVPAHKQHLVRLLKDSTTDNNTQNHRPPPPRTEPFGASWCYPPFESSRLDSNSSSARLHADGRL